VVSASSPKTTLQGDKRILLTMATGAGKTFVAFQITTFCID